MSFVATHIRPISLCLPLAMVSCAAAGCATGPKVEIPVPTTRPANVTGGAMLFATQSGNAIFNITSTGVFSVIDNSTDVCIFATPVMSGQRVFFSPERKQIFLNNAVVYQGPMDPSHQYRFYFERE